MGLYRTEGTGERDGGSSERRTRPVATHTEQRIALPARHTAAFDDVALGELAPRPRVATDQTTSFEAPENARPSRLLKARLKVNSTRQGTPRPTGPWSPGAVQRAIELKSNESGEVAPNAPVWPRPSTETVEYEAFAALSKKTVPVAPSLIARPRLGLRRSPIASTTDDKLTRPVTAAPDLLLRPRPEEALLPRVNALVFDARHHGKDLPSVILPSTDSHAVEMLVATLLFAFALGLLYLNLS